MVLLPTTLEIWAEPGRYHAVPAASRNTSFSLAQGVH